MSNTTDLKRSHKALYEEVRAEPTIKAPKRYGMSNNGLSKVFRSMDIPLPDRGYWAKVQAGKPVMALIPFGGALAYNFSLKVNGDTVKFSISKAKGEIPHEMTQTEREVSCTESCKRLDEEKKERRERKEYLRRKNVRVKIAPNFLLNMADQNDRNSLERLSEASFTVGIGQSWYVCFGSHLQIQQMSKEKLPLHLTYSDFVSAYEEVITIDLSQYFLALIYESPTENLRQEIKKMAKDTHSIDYSLQIIQKQPRQSEKSGNG